jgi:preprotein translocase SecE subunit
MAATESKERAMSEPDERAARGGNGPGSPEGGARALPTHSSASTAARAAGGGPGFFHIYKPGQGALLRWSTAAGAGIVALAGAAFLSDQLAWFSETVRVLVPILFLVAMAILIFRLVAQKRSVVEFLIATEGEMKKVNWSTKREVIGSTKVVIVTILALGLILFLVDILFMLFFSSIGVLEIDVFKALFGGGPQ